MIQALGISSTLFDPKSPGRLCRGRERWIQPFELTDDLAPIHRVVVSGAEFVDDAAANATRGLPHSKVDVAQVVQALFPRKTLVAFMEDGHPADIPDAAEHVEMYTANRAGGRTEELAVRWTRTVSGLREIREVLGPETQPRALGFLLLDADHTVDDDAVREALFLLVGMSTLDSPPAQFQPAALPHLLTMARAVILLHRDKHGPAMGVYSHEPVVIEGRLEPLCAKAESLLVTFGIPPMLARWDRALYELRERWDEDELGPFPVPQAPEGQRWQPRRRTRRKPEPVVEDTPPPAASDEESPVDPAMDDTEPDEFDALLEVSSEE